jgi:hypothetical protein
MGSDYQHLYLQKNSEFQVICQIIVPYKESNIT